MNFLKQLYKHKTNNYLKGLLGLLLVTTLVVITYKTVDLRELQQHLFQFSKVKLSLLFTISLIITLVKAYRFYLLTKNVQINLDFTHLLKMFIASQAITPLPGGEAGRAYLLKKEAKVPMLKSSGPVLSQAYIEVFSAVVLAVLGSFFFKILRVPATLMGIVLLLIAIILLSSIIFNWVIRIIPNKRICSKISNVRNTLKDNLIQKGSIVPKRVFIKNFLLALLMNFLGGLMVFIIAEEFKLDLDLFKSVFIYSAAIVVSTVTTVVPGGLGLTEGGLAGVLMLFKSPVPQAVAAVLIFRLVTFVFPLILGLAFLFFFYHKILIGGRHAKN